MHKGERVPPGWLLDRNGNGTTNPSDLYDGGAIRTFGEYKGYALSLLIEVIGGILSGAETPIFPDYNYMHNGVFLLAINPIFFRPGQEYVTAVDYLFNSVRQALPACGMDGPLLPGEPEERTRAIRLQHGIPIDDRTWSELVEVAAGFGIVIQHEPLQQSAPMTTANNPSF